MLACTGGPPQSLVSSDVKLIIKVESSGAVILYVVLTRAGPLAI